jgi:hypothetical protein
VTRGYLPHSILVPLSTNDRSDHLSSTPPTPIRRDISVPSRAPLPLPRANYDRSRNVLPRATTEPCLINSSHNVEEETEQIYLNQFDCQPPVVEIAESHQSTSTDVDNLTPSESNEQEQVSIIQYSFLIIFLFLINLDLYRII